jgi:16S rRNA processing protein RimM
VPGFDRDATPELVVVGRIGAPHGVRGGVRVSSATQPPDNILRYRPWWVNTGSGFRRVAVISVREHGDGFVATIEGVTDRDAADGLRGAEVAVPRSALPALEAGREYYWQDLIGLEVIDQHGASLGPVRELIETGANDVLVVGEEGVRPVLIPFVGAVVTEVDLDAGRIRVDWLEPA